MEAASSTSVGVVTLFCMPVKLNWDAATLRVSQSGSNLLKSGDAVLVQVSKGSSGAGVLDPPARFHFRVATRVRPRRFHDRD